MKKQLLALTMAAAAVAGANAQAVLGYGVTKTQGSYTPLSNPTVVYDAAAAETPVTDNMIKTVWSPDGVQTGTEAQGYALGFTATVAGTDYTDFLISGGGYIYLGNGQVAMNPAGSGNFMNMSGDYNIVGAGNQRDSKGTPATKISYQVSGEGADAVLTVQYENIGQMYSFFGDPATIDMQLSLAANGTFSVTYNNLANVGDGNRLFMLMGVRQGSNYVCAVEGSDAPAIMRNDFSTYPVQSTEADGTTFVFTPPTVCAAPAGAPAQLTVSATSTQVSGSYDAVSDADTYLVLYTMGQATDFTPVNGTVYTKGQQVAEGVSVAYFGPDTQFTLNNLDPSTAYGINVYAANSYGIGGPVYSEQKAQVVAVTLPGAPAAVEVGECGLNSIQLNITPNAANDDVVVLYTDYCQRDNYGDHGLFGQLEATSAQGDVLAVPADFTPMFNYEGAPQPANGGVVAYAGKVDGPVTISGLDASTGYYLAVYSRNADGKYSSDVIYSGASTQLTAPADGTSYNYPRYQLPFGWTGSVMGDNTFEFVDQLYFVRGAISQGTQPIQQYGKLNRGDAVGGKEAWMTLPPVAVPAGHTQLTMNYCINEGVSRFATNPYTWTENDQLALRVSTDNGATWTVAREYNITDHPQQDDKLAYSDMSADLTAYAGQTVLVQVYFKTYSAPAFGLNMYVDRISLQQVEDTSVPTAVNVGQIGATSAVVSWTGAQTNYKLRYKGAADSDYTEVIVEGATTYTLTDLQAKTAYTLNVSGQLAEGYTDWSEAAEFTTTDYPALDAPEGLEAVVGNEHGTSVTLSWNPVTNATHYEVAYRKSTATSWTMVEQEAAMLELTDLEPLTTYICKVRAYGSPYRTSAYSAQVSFQTGESSGIETVSLDAAADAQYYDLSGRRILNPTPGLYLRHIDGKISKVVVK